ncbi:MoaD/ThiS family protein [Amycolatopsis rhizosphaerae]|uniref:MoaD/ThiS family protein n=1 Tax=Amycolatopsis rhizosphaerae TaxID=2053003 RepID=A0A558DHV0_9PSEU|nr:MoaD/ThiS family protein [Amycolatopsis rhizosphaerae]
MSTAWTQGSGSTFECGAGPLGDVLKRFAADEPRYRHRILGEDGEPFRYYNVYLDGQALPRRDRDGVMVGEDSTVHIVPPLAGG